MFDLGVVHWQVPAVGGVPHAVAAGAQQGGLPLGGHGLQRGENRVPPGAAAAAQRLAYAQVQRAVLVNVQTGALRVGWVGGVRGQVRGQVVACCGREIVCVEGGRGWREGGDRERESLIKVAVSDFINKVFGVNTAFPNSPPHHVFGSWSKNRKRTDVRRT